MRRVDKLGRIVIPLELRKKYGLVEGAKIEFLDVGEGVTVRASDSVCRICRGRICETSEIPLCESCIAEVIKSQK